MDERDWTLLFRIGRELGFRPDHSGETVELMTRVVEESRSDEDPEAYLRTRLSKLFRCVDQRPDWIQDSEWPVGIEPMVFVGQLEVPGRAVKGSANSVIYVFLDYESGDIRSVRQWE